MGLEVVKMSIPGQCLSRSEGHQDRQCCPRLGANLDVVPGEARKTMRDGAVEGLGRSEWLAVFSHPACVLKSPRLEEGPTAHNAILSPAAGVASSCCQKDGEEQTGVFHK